MSSEIFCDTSFFVALLDRKDSLHQKALNLSEEITQFSLCATNEVLIETLNYFSRFGAEIRKAASGFVTAIAEHHQYVVIYSKSTIFEKALSLYQRRPDKTYSCTDCISMIIMQERGIMKVATYDKHFGQEGFEVLM